MIWNVLVKKDQSSFVFGYQVEANTISEAVKKAEFHYGGILLKVCLAEYEQD